MLMMSCNASSGNVPTVRQPAVAGQFYPAGREELLRELKTCFRSAGAPVSLTGSTVQAVIVPHAGYVFSAATAAKAYAAIPADAHYDRVFLIGPSHHVGFSGASVATAFDCYSTPLGNVPVDTVTGRALKDADSCFTYLPQAHDREHCLEVQLPLLQYHLKQVPPIVPIIIGTEELRLLLRMVHALKPYFNSRNLFVISSDFSHYPSYSDAEKVDSLTAQAIMTGRTQSFVETLGSNDSLGIRHLATSACGQCGIAVLMLLAEGDSTLTMHHLGYCNSGDSPYGGRDEVVGYHAFALSRAAQPDAGFHLSEADGRQLTVMARQSIVARLQGTHYCPEATGGALSVKTGAFVTLTEQGRLRGCIGLFSYDKPLWQVVCQMAEDAAFADPRFPPVKASELKDIHIEISVLTPLKLIHDVSEFHYGREGIFMRKGSRSGTFLPQVAQEVNWTKEEFLGHCAQDKAGIGWDGWRTAELYTYEAIVVEE